MDYWVGRKDSLSCFNVNCHIRRVNIQTGTPEHIIPVTLPQPWPNLILLLPKPYAIYSCGVQYAGVQEKRVACAFGSFESRSVGSTVGGLH